MVPRLQGRNLKMKRQYFRIDRTLGADETGRLVPMFFFSTMWSLHEWYFKDLEEEMEPWEIGQMLGGN